MKKIKILHLSDLQFGYANRFVGNKRYQKSANFDIFAQRIFEDFDNLFHSSPDIIVITGDIAESASAPEYVIASNFFSRLKTLFKSNDHKFPSFYFVPGNHDVSWQDTKSCESLDMPFPWFEHKFRNYNEFIKKFTGSDTQSLSQAKNYFVKLDGTKEIIVLGFNSAYRNSHRSSDNYGDIPIDDVKDAIKEADEIDPSRDLVRVACLHHNFIRASSNDEENLRNADELRYVLEKGSVDIILHGHSHTCGANLLRNLITQDQIAVLSTGSAGLDSPKLPEVPNQLQAITIEKNNSIRITIFRRVFSVQTIGSSGKGVWTPDASEVEKGVFTFYLHKMLIREILETIQRRLCSTFYETKDIYFPRGFETNELYSILLSIAKNRLLILGRKNHKLFEKDHIKQLQNISRLCQENNFEFKVLFLSPDAPRYVLNLSHQDPDIKIQLQRNLENVKRINKRAKLRLDEVLRVYDKHRTTAIIIIDKFIIYHRIRFDNKDKPERLTDTSFNLICADSGLGKELEDTFLEFWNSGSKIS